MSARIAELITDFLEGRGGATADEIVEQGRRWGDELMRLGDIAWEIARRREANLPIDIEAADQVVLALREALAPVESAGPLVQDFFTILNWRYRRGSERMAAAERLMLLLNPHAKRPADARRHALVATLFDVVLAALEPGARGQVPIGMGVGGDEFARWLAGRLGHNRRVFHRDEHPRGLQRKAGKEHALPERPADESTPEDLAAIASALSPRERQLAARLAAGENLADAARAMKISKNEARWLLSQLRRRLKDS